MQNANYIRPAIELNPRHPAAFAIALALVAAAIVTVILLSTSGAAPRHSPGVPASRAVPAYNQPHNYQQHSHGLF
jgi:hypothetical protein